MCINNVIKLCHIPVVYFDREAIMDVLDDWDKLLQLLVLGSGFAMSCAGSAIAWLAGA